MLKNFQQFIFENYDLNVEGAMFKNRKEAEQNGESFIISNTPFPIKGVYLPKEGFGAVESDFASGRTAFHIEMKKNSFYLFSRYVTKDDTRYDRMRKGYEEEFGNKARIVILNGTPDMKHTGKILFLGGGDDYVVGNYNDPSSYKANMAKIYDAIISSDNEGEFEEKLKGMEVMSNKEELKNRKDFQKKALK